MAVLLPRYYRFAGLLLLSFLVDYACAKATDCTSQSMSYTIDVYRKDLRAARNLEDVLLYVSLFPQLVAGRGPWAAGFGLTPFPWSTVSSNALGCALENSA
jgi:hypothetical protein